MRGVICLLCAALALSGCKKEKRKIPEVPVEPMSATDGTADGARPGPMGEGDPEPPTEPAPAGPVMEKEPNGARTNASVLPINGGLRGSLSQPDKADPLDEDWYVLTLPGPGSQQVRVQLSPEDGSDYTLVWKTAQSRAVEAPKTRKRRRKKPSNPEDLATIDRGKAGEVEVFPPTILKPGRHYFQVRLARSKKAQPYAPERGYRLTTIVIDPEPGMEHEPNDTREEAGGIRPGETRQGYLGWYGDGDWYEVDLSGVPEAAILRADVTGVAGVKTRLWVTDREGGSLVKVPEPKVPWEVGKALTIRDVGITGQGPYYVEVRSMKSANPHDKYSLTITAEVPQTRHEREPNWRAGNATTLSVDEPTDGFIGHSTDWDVFKLEAPESMIATLVLSGVPGVDLKVELLDGKRVANTVDEGAVGDGETMPLIPVGPGPAWIRLSSKSYTFNVEKSYRVLVTMEEAGNREVEPNDDLAAAERVVLKMATPIEGLIHPRGDVDHFTLDVKAPTLDETRILTIRLTGVDGLSLTAALFDEEKAMITKKSGIGPGIKTITHGFTPGRYYIRIREDTGTASNATVPYTLEVTD